MQIIPTYKEFVKILNNNLGKDHDLYVQSDTLLADIFNSFWDKCLVINGFDPAPFLSAPRLVWQAALKKPK